MALYTNAVTIQCDSAEEFAVLKQRVDDYAANPQNPPCEPAHDEEALTITYTVTQQIDVDVPD